LAGVTARTVRDPFSPSALGATCNAALGLRTALMRGLAGRSPPFTGAGHGLSRDRHASARGPSARRPPTGRRPSMGGRSRRSVGRANRDTVQCTGDRSAARKSRHRRSRAAHSKAAGSKAPHKRAADSTAAAKDAPGDMCWRGDRGPPPTRW